MAVSNTMGAEEDMRWTTLPSHPASLPIDAVKKEIQTVQGELELAQARMQEARQTTETISSSGAESN